MAKRKYHHKDVDMLMAAKTLISNFKKHKKEIIAIRSTWQDPYITNLEKQVDHAIKTHLGLQSAKNLKLATQEVYHIQTHALRDLALFKASIQVDYSSDKIALKWILDTFGFTAHLTPSRNKDQEALIQLLQKFTNNMTPELKTEIIQKGTSPKLITNIEQYADTLTNANITQETHKGTVKELTYTKQKELNDIYSKAIVICTIAVKIFKNNPAVKDKFVFSKLVSNLNLHKTNTEPKPSQNPPTEQKHTLAHSHNPAQSS